MSNLTVEHCNESEVEMVMNYINDHWEEDHILSKDRALFTWQYKRKSQNIYNFLKEF